MAWTTSFSRLIFTLCNHVIKWLLTRHESKDNLRFKWQLHPRGIMLHKHLQFPVEILSIFNINTGHYAYQKKGNNLKKIWKPEKISDLKTTFLATISLLGYLHAGLFISTFSFAKVLAGNAFSLHSSLIPFQKYGRKLVWPQFRIRGLRVTEIKRLCLRSQSSEYFVNQTEERKFREGQGLAFYPSGLAYTLTTGEKGRCGKEEKSLLVVLAFNPCHALFGFVFSLVSLLLWHYSSPPHLCTPHLFGSDPAPQISSYLSGHSFHASSPIQPPILSP